MRELPLPLSLLRGIGFASCLLAAVLPIILLPEGLRVIAPLLLWPMVYGWVLFFPLALPLPLVFLLALINDVLMGLPLGMMPLATLLLSWLAQKEARSAKRNFATLWLHFAIYSFTAMLLLGAVLTLYQWRLVALQPMVIQWVFTLLCYPPLHSLLLHSLRSFKLEDAE